MKNFSEMRKLLNELNEEQNLLINNSMQPGKMVRGSLRPGDPNHKNCRQRFPQMSRTVNRKVIGRSVKKDHVKWLEPLIAKHRSYRETQTRLRKIQKEIDEIIENLRYEKLFDYEPKCDDCNYLIPVKKGK
jgi:hypothetical protein